MKKSIISVMVGLIAVSQSAIAGGYYDRGTLIEATEIEKLGSDIATATLSDGRSVTYSKKIILKADKGFSIDGLIEKYDITLDKRMGGFYFVTANNIESVFDISQAIFEKEPVTLVQPSFQRETESHAISFGRSIANDKELASTMKPQIRPHVLGDEPNDIESILDDQGSVNYWRFYDDIFRYHDEAFWHLHNKGGFSADAYYDGELSQITAVEDVDINGINVIAQDITGKGVKIAVIDTAFSMTHPDLKLSGGRNYYSESMDVSPGNSEDTHGTSVAGVIGASRGNNYGIMGVAPDAYVYAVNGLFDINSRTTFTAAYVEIFLQAIEDGIDIINCSWSSLDALDEATEEAIRSFTIAGRDGKGGLVVYSSGNEGVGTLSNEAALAEGISVGAIEADGSRSLYSNYGTELDLVAPSNFVSLDLTGMMGLHNGEMGYVAGTSFSSPIVSGVIALMLEVNSDLTANQIKKILYGTTKKVGQDFSGPQSYDYQRGIDPNDQFNEVFTKSYETGYGLVDAEQAVIEAAKLVTEPDEDAGQPVPPSFGNGWSFMGTSTPITDMTIFDESKIVWAFLGGQWYGYSSNSDYMDHLEAKNIKLSFIPQNSGYWVYED